ncbi:MAG TPA: aspartate--tRNA ligase, partial [Sphingomicrobium sp.]|nr:aspartate--tRNA ligase [Sphingomicrobium sp.]
MHPYRTHNCGQLRASDVGSTVRLSGWVHRKRDHGGVLFVDLRDHHGITQVVAAAGSPVLDALDALRVESVVTVAGEVVARGAEVVNPKLPTGEIEVVAREVEVRSSAAELPMPVAGEADYPEEIRLRYRYLDLRRESMHRNIMLRSAVIASIRRRMISQGFTEFQTPILTASSPEGARDYLVPSRVHPGKFYALPQAPQMFKQLIMVAGFDRYFQIAPCFRDEDARADRSPGEFYQLDFEMSFVTQDDVFAAIEPVLSGVFEEFADGRTVTPAGEYPRIPYKEALLKYGTDKPDLRNPLLITDVSGQFEGSGFGLFAGIVGKGGVVRAVPAPGTAEKSRKFFDDMNEWARGEGFAGLGYATRKSGEWGGPIAKNHGEEGMNRIAEAMGLGPDDGIFFAAGTEGEAARLAGAARARVGEQLGLVEEGAFRFCWIVDFPMFEYNEEQRKIDFSHNPFSMPQGEMEALETKDPLDILAWQYDIVCNGVELSSGAIRNHRPDIMYKAFEIAGYTREEVDINFAGMINAFKYGAPP